MKQLVRIILLPLLLVTTLAVAAPEAYAAKREPVWEVVEDRDAAAGLPLQQIERFDVAVSNGYIYISVAEPVKVEVFTILGQLVTSRTVNPGIVRLSIPHRGIYIIKGAGFTRRVNL